MPVSSCRGRQLFLFLRTFLSLKDVYTGVGFFVKDLLILLRGETGGVFETKLRRSLILKARKRFHAFSIKTRIFLAKNLA